MTIEATITSNGKTIKVGDKVYFQVVEQIWNKPYVMKRHHTYDTRSVLLCGEVLSIVKDELKAKLTDNNGFEKDGEEFVFHKGSLLVEQDFKKTEKLGKWEYQISKD